MKIAIVRRKIGAFGGGEWFLHEVANGLLNRGHEVHLIAEKTDLDLGGNIQHHCTHLPKSPLKSSKAFRLWAENIINTLQPVVVLSGERAVAGDIYRAGDGVHAAWLDRYAEATASPLKQVLIRKHPRHRLLLRLEDELYTSDRLKMVIANSALVAAEIKKYHPAFPQKNIQVLPNAIRVARYRNFARQHSPQECRKKLGLPDHRPIILFAGNNFKRKGLSALLNAVRYLGSIEPVVVVLGQGKERDYRTQIKQLPDMVAVRFRGLQSEVLPFYRAASLLALPTIYDPFSNVCLEAMAMDLPVITTPANGFAEVIRAHRVGGIIGEDGSLTELLKTYLNVEQARQCQERIAEVIDQYDMRSFIEQLERLFEQVKENAGRGTTRPGTMDDKESN